MISGWKKKRYDSYLFKKTGDQKFERKDVKLGISDGENVEILEGVEEEDAVKVPYPMTIQCLFYLPPQ